MLANCEELPSAPAPEQTGSMQMEHEVGPMSPSSVHELLSKLHKATKDVGAMPAMPGPIDLDAKLAALRRQQKQGSQKLTIYFHIFRNLLFCLVALHTLSPSQGKGPASSA